MNFEKDKELLISTSSITWNPHSIIAISVWIVDERLILADCQMNLTIKNLKENPKISIIWWYHRIKWEAEITPDGKYFEICKAENEDSGFIVKNAVSIKINEVYDLDSGVLIFQNKKWDI